MKMFDHPVAKPKEENVSKDPSSAKEEQTSVLDPKDYVVVNIWASEENKALEGANVGHISLETRFDYISLWPGPRPESHMVDPHDTFAKTKRAIYRYFGERPPSFKQNYTEDCLGEAMSEDRYREINNINKCKENEVAYIFNEEDRTFKPIQEQPKHLDPSEHLIAVDLCRASVRLVLYSLQVDKITSEFKSLNKSIKGWQLAGSNMLTRTFQEKSTESCASLAFRCLKAGGLYGKLSSKLSSDTSSVTSPDLLIKHVVACKARELADYPETKGWECKACPDENSVEEIAKAYKEVGQEANAEKRSLGKIFGK